MRSTPRQASAGVMPAAARPNRLISRRQILSKRSWPRSVAVIFAALGLAGLSLNLEGTVPRRSAPRTEGFTPAARVPVSNAAFRTPAASVPPSGLPVFPPQIVDPYNDDPSHLRRAGLLRGPLPLPSHQRIAGGCTFDIECDDGNPCTLDTCNINIPDGTNAGVCLNTQLPAGAPGECGDGVYCNGLEFCDAAGTCVSGLAPTCCNDGEADEYCAETMGACDDASADPGRRCATDAECSGGKCNHCRSVCANDADCSDGLNCNGAELCVGGECFPGNPPCGAGALCSEKRCIGQSPPKACLTSQDCNQGIVCDSSQGPFCYRGRCCTNVAEATCANRFFNLGAGPSASCAGRGEKFFPGDTGVEFGENNTCGGANPAVPGTQLGCPKYSSGAEQLTVENPPSHPVAAGPISASPASVSVPKGPGAPLNRLGDDYTNITNGYLSLTGMRFVGYMAVPDAVFFEFWDADGNFIEEVLFRPSTGVGINLLILKNPITIPPAGRVTAISKREFGLNSRFIWMSATGATTGTNDVDVLFVNDDPDASNFMSPHPGVLAFELLGTTVAPPLGGCCRPDGTCSNETKWMCSQLDGQFQGVGNFCNTCRLGSGHGAACGRCVGGSNPGMTCNSAAECDGGACQPDDTVCNAGSDTCSNNPTDTCVVDGECPALLNICSNANVACALDSDCPPGGTCGGAPTCEEGSCIALAVCGEGACCNAGDGSCTLTAAGACSSPDTFLGLGSACEPNCCIQPAADTDCSDGICYTGADNCADAFVHPIPELPCTDCGPGGTPSDTYVVTITGDNTYASATEANPDSCWGTADEVDSDQGWWEAFELVGACTRVRFDYCCTSPIQYGDWGFLAKDCACDELISSAPDPYLFTPLGDNRGAPFCDEDNFWSIMGILRQGTYYLPVNSTLEDELGQYQLHIVAEACPKAACCLADGTCVADVDVYQCENQNGIYQGQPNKYPPAETCTANLCTTGSCCTEMGCADEINGVLIDQQDCDGLQGDFTPGVRCEGGICVNNPAYSCSSAINCPSGQCTGGAGGAAALAQPSPCPICSLESSTSCQLYDNPSAYKYSIADLSVGSGQVVADDFVATELLTSIEQVCVWGIYVIADPDSFQNDCGESRTADYFRVRILASSEAGLPDIGNVIGSTSATAERALIPGQSSLTVWDPPVETYGFQLTLDTPIVGLIPGETYWLEVANNLSPLDECAFWLIQLSNNSPQGNNFSAIGSDAGGYPPGSQHEVDFAFCLSGPFETPPAPVRPCCTCSGQCFISESWDCNNHLGHWAVEAVNDGIPLTCDSEFQCPAGMVNPPNDECSNAVEVGVGLHPVSILCATTDPSLNPIQTEYGLDNMNYDIWFEFTAPQDGTLVASMCALPDVFDSVIAVYSNGTGTCTCPTQPVPSEPTFVDANDEGCGIFLSAGWTSIVEVPAQAGQCFLIRIGNWAASNTRGVGVVDISCGPPICGDNAAQAVLNEECDGSDDAACPGLCRPPGDPQPCTCGPPPECGDGIRQGDEMCDPGNGQVPPDDDACPGFCLENCFCTCACGNGIAECDEECDGPADTTCGGAAARCLPDCTCPPVVCGNNFTDLTEECDGTDDGYCPGDCREPGDPAGECTCRCPVLIDPFCTPITSFPVVSKTRFASFAITPECAGDDHAIRVELTSLHHPSSPPPGTPDFGAHEGTFRYVNSFGGSTTCVDSATFNTNYRCAQLGCQPEYRDWFATLSNTTNPDSPAALIHVTGEAVVPSSTYSVAMIASLCGASPQADICTAASAAMSVSTSRWGDVAGGGGTPPDGGSNVIDIGTVVDCVKGLDSALPEYRCWLKNPTNPATNAVNVIDIGLAVDAVKGLPYPYSILACP